MPPAFAQHIRTKPRSGMRRVYRMYHKTHRTNVRVVRLPLAKGESMTMDGRPAVNGLLGKLRDTDLGSVRMLSLPNSWNHLQADHAMAFRVLPLGPRQTLVTTWWLVNKDAGRCGL